SPGEGSRDNGGKDDVIRVIPLQKQLAFMFLDDAASNGKNGAGPPSLGRKEWVEDLKNGTIRNLRPRVLKRNTNRVVTMPPHINFDARSLWRGLNSIAHQV